MMDPAKPGSRPRPQVAPKQRMRAASDDGLSHKWDPQPNVSPFIALNSRSTSPPPQGGKRAVDTFAVEHAKLYPSYVVETSSPDLPYEAHVQGWLYAPGINRKGKLMAAAVERLIGNPGKYASIADAAAQAQAEDALGDVEEPSPNSTWLGMNLRPSMFRTKSSKGSAPNSQPSSATPSENNSRSPSRATSPELGDRVRQTPPMSPVSLDNAGLQSPSSLGSPGTSPFSSTENVAALNLDMQPPPKRPGMRRTATYTFDARSNPKGKSSSASSHARREQKQIVRERLAAISHKSLAIRNVQISVLSEPDSKGHRKRRTFWTETDDAGRFSYMCPVNFRPERVRANSGTAVAFTECLFVPRSGISVISDIDDTVRHTGVTKSKRELLQNVLVRGYDECQIEGVRDWFQNMARAGATFHYVSNSPWQLFDVIHGFLRHHSFPEGSMHLKKYAGVFDGLTEQPKGRKKAALEKILRDFPDRKFILIGDSGEADLEAYSELTRKFPLQVLAIYIRDITIPQDEPLYDPRAHTTHRRHHSADLINMEAAPHIPSSPMSAPVLPPRRRQVLNVLPKKPPQSPQSSPPASPQVPELPPRPDLPPRKALFQSSQEPATDTIDAIVRSAEQSDQQPSHESSSDRTVVLDRTSPPVTTPNVPTIKTTLPSSPSSNAPPKLPPRPKLLRRTSSKILDGVSAVASASSQAVGSAARFLGPHPQNGGTQGASASNPQTSKTKSRSLRFSNPYIGDDLPDQHSSQHRKGLSGSSGSSGTSTGSLNQSQHRISGSPSSPHLSSEVNDNGVFVTSSQDFVDIDRDRVDKRAEQWKMRLVKQHRLLPKHVQLKAWRQPEDVQEQSLRIIRGDQSLI